MKNDMDGDPEIRIQALEKARKEIEDSLIVMAHLETRQSNVIKLQAEQMDRLQQDAAEQRKLNQETDTGIANLVSALGEFMRRVQP